MELDHIILEKICLHKYNIDADQPALINLRDWQTTIHDDNWHTECFFSVGKGTRWFGQDSLVVFADEYMRELTTTRREEKLNQLGIK
jgi:hypothetical protein